MNGVVRIEFQIEGGQLKLMVNAPMENQEQKNLTVQILAQAIPIVCNYQPSILIKPNGAPRVSVPPAPKAN